MLGMSEEHATKLVSYLQPGSCIYDYEGKICNITYIDDSPNGERRLWHKSTLSRSGYSFCYENTLIERFMKFGPIDNDPIIVYEQEFNIQPETNKSLTEDLLSLEEYRGYLKGIILDEVRSSKDIDLLEKIKKLLGEGYLNG